MTHPTPREIRDADAALALLEEAWSYYTPLTRPETADAKAEYSDWGEEELAKAA